MDTDMMVFHLQAERDLDQMIGHAYRASDGHRLRRVIPVDKAGLYSSSLYARLPCPPVGEHFTTHMGEQPVQPFTVRGRKIDDLAERLGGRVDFIKIDVEGAEPLALRGAANVIRDNRNLSIVMEWSPGQIAAAGFDVAEFVDEIDARGLQLFILERHAERPLHISKLASLPYQSAIILKSTRAG